MEATYTLACERVLAEIAAELEIARSRLDEDLYRTLITEASHVRQVEAAQRRAARLTRLALEKDWTSADPLFDPRVPPAEVERIAIGMANHIDAERRISDAMHARLHHVLKKEMALYWSSRATQGAAE